MTNAVNLNELVFFLNFLNKENRREYFTYNEYSYLNIYTIGGNDESYFKSNWNSIYSCE